MKDYNETSDHEINVMVAAKLGVDAKCEDGCLFTSKKHVGENVISVTTVTDYCNNPSDMWPLIVENGICIHVDNIGENSYANTFDSHGYCEKEFYDKNQLRAAAIVFLMMNED